MVRRPYRVNRRYMALERAEEEPQEPEVTSRPGYKLLPADWKNPYRRPQRLFPWQQEMLREYDGNPQEFLYYFKDFRPPNDPYEHPALRWRARNPQSRDMRTFDDDEENEPGLRQEFQQGEIPSSSYSWQRSNAVNVPRGPRDSAHLLGSAPPPSSFLGDSMFDMELEDEEVRPAVTRKEEGGRRNGVGDVRRNKKRIHKSLSHIEVMLAKMKQKLKM